MAGPSLVTAGSVRVDSGSRIGSPAPASPKRAGRLGDPRKMESRMDLKLDDGLKTLLDSGKRKGFLTFAQVNEFLPDDAVNLDKLEQLLQVPEEQGIELIEESEAEERESETRRPEAAEEERGDTELAFLDDDDGKRVDDPVRMYLT